MMKRMLAICLLLLLLAGCMPPADTGSAAQTAPNGRLESTTAAVTMPQDTTEAPETTPAATTPAAGETAPLTSPAATTPAPTTPETTTTAPTTPAPTTPEPTAPAPTTPAHQHSYAASQTAPTCAAKGYTKYTCPCGHSYKADYVDALGHSYTSQVVAPTTASEGYTEHTCGVCGHSYKDNYTEKLPIEPCEVHDFRHKDIYKNCQQDGCREHTCIVCGYTYRDEYDYHTPDDHRYKDEPDEIKEATYDAPGYEKYKCGFCDYVYTRVLPQLEVIDTAALESYGRSYAKNTYGYDSSSSLNASNSGYAPGVLCKISTMEEGKKWVRDAVTTRYENDVATVGGAYIEVNGEIFRRTVNVYVQPTSDPHLFRIWVYYK